jgi:hypothetical protein
MFVYKYIYFSMQYKKNYICGTQYVTFKHLLFYMVIKNSLCT